MGTPLPDSPESGIDLNCSLPMSQIPNSQQNSQQRAQFHQHQHNADFSLSAQHNLFAMPSSSYFANLQYHPVPPPLWNQHPGSMAPPTFYSPPTRPHPQQRGESSNGRSMAAGEIPISVPAGVTVQAASSDPSPTAAYSNATIPPSSSNAAVNSVPVATPIPSSETEDVEILPAPPRQGQGSKSGAGSTLQGDTYDEEEDLLLVLLANFLLILQKLLEVKRRQQRRVRQRLDFDGSFSSQFLSEESDMDSEQSISSTNACRGCLYANLKDNIVRIVPAFVGFFVSAVFIALPSKRHGIGFPVSPSSFSFTSREAKYLQKREAQLDAASLKGPAAAEATSSRVGPKKQ
ncbi:hypothetical protein R1sor_005173 [Riccia sorocarpa]|uniref:Uncharacterized protein n=1 Tax=Riccia sorocarpa TaxID=122646 RepID=A0ABD3HLS1_9MARC